jgi:hypothetical protein
MTKKAKHENTKERKDEIGDECSNQSFELHPEPISFRDFLLSGFRDSFLGAEKFDDQKMRNTKTRKNEKAKWETNAPT